MPTAAGPTEHGGDSELLDALQALAQQSMGKQECHSRIQRPEDRHDR
jgi:hypothetical protein